MRHGEKVWQRNHRLVQFYYSLLDSESPYGGLFTLSTQLINQTNIASRATQSNSVYVSVLKIPIVLADGVSGKSLLQKFLFSRERPLYFATIMDTNRDSAH